MLRRLAFVIRLLAVLAIGLVLWDAMVFRSGFYTRWLEPRSTAGATRDALRFTDKTYLAGRRNVLVLGDSRIGEGFSQTLADAGVAGSDLHFINAAISGTDPRVWYYLLRALDPTAERFAAIVLMVPYDPADQTWPIADYASDIAYAAPLLRLGDLATFPDSFDSADRIAQARRAILFPAQPLRSDIAALIDSPRSRLKHVRDFRKNYVGYQLHYAGRAEALPDLALDPQTLQPSTFDRVDPAKRDSIRNYFSAFDDKAPPAVLESNERYYRMWLTRIAEPYRARAAQVVIFQIPRGPWHGARAPTPQAKGAIADLAQSGLLTLLPGDSFVALEEPRYFFDTMHMNGAGRARFSPLLAQRVAEALH